MGCQVVRPILLVYMGAGEMRHPRRYAIRVLAEVQEVSAKGARSYRRPAFVPTRGQDGIERPQQRNLGGVPGRPVVANSVEKLGFQRR